MDSHNSKDHYEMKAVLGALMQQIESMQKCISELETENACMSELVENLSKVQLKHHQRLNNLEEQHI